MIAAQVPGLESEVNGGARFTIPGVDYLSAPRETLPRFFSNISDDHGTGNQIASPPTPATNAILGPSESQAIANASVSNAGQWETAAQAVGGDTASILQQLAQSGASGGQNAPLGPQVDFAPASIATSSPSGGGAGTIVFIVGIVVVGVLAYLHFRKKKAAEAQ